MVLFQARAGGWGGRVRINYKVKTLSAYFTCHGAKGERGRTYCAYDMVEMVAALALVTPHYPGRGDEMPVLALLTVLQCLAWDRDCVGVPRQVWVWLEKQKCLPRGSFVRRVVIHAL